jgi:hypothetical protein
MEYVLVLYIYAGVLAQGDTIIDWTLGKIIPLDN